MFIENISKEYVFEDAQGVKVTQQDIFQKLVDVGARDCKTLFVHTDITFGKPNPKLGRKGYLQALWDILQSLQVDTLMFPAFSYSFCNHEDYDVRNTKTTMGALIEFVRKQDGVVRSLDPLVSIIGVGKEADKLLGNPGNNAFGVGSGFDKLHQMNDVKFLFFGADFSEYFTYIHHLEKIANVPYRYDQEFTGNIIDYDGNKYPHNHVINTQCGKVKLRNFAQLKQDLSEKGSLGYCKLGNLELSSIAEKDIYDEVLSRIKANPFSFVYPYTEEDLTHEYTFGKNGERVTHC